MNLVALLGYPLGHSATPAIYGATFPAMGIDARCEAWPTPPEELSGVVARLCDPVCLGANVTVPHKEAVMPLLDEVHRAARAIGAVNCIVHRDGRLVGHNTDALGFLQSLQDAAFDPHGKTAVVLGAGGAARAVAYALASAGASRVLVSGRTPARVRELVEALASTAAGCKLDIVDWQPGRLAKACRAADLVVNCTPLGMRHGAEAESPVGPDAFRSAQLAFDLVYNPPETPFLAAARAAGASAVSGLDMLIYQGAESIRLWTGREPPINVMRRAARQALEIPD